MERKSHGENHPARPKRLSRIIGKQGIHGVTPEALPKIAERVIDAPEHFSELVSGEQFVTREHLKQFWEERQKNSFRRNLSCSVDIPWSFLISFWTNATGNLAIVDTYQIREINEETKHARHKAGIVVLDLTSGEPVPAGFGNFNDHERAAVQADGLIHLVRTYYDNPYYERPIVFNLEDAEVLLGAFIDQVEANIAAHKQHEPAHSA